MPCAPLASFAHTQRRAVQAQARAQAERRAALSTATAAAPPSPAAPCGPLQATLTCVLPGLYEVTFGFYGRKKPVAQLMVNGEPTLLAANKAGNMAHSPSSGAWRRREGAGCRSRGAVRRRRPPAASHAHLQQQPARPAQLAQLAQPALADGAAPPPAPPPALQAS